MVVHRHLNLVLRSWTHIAVLRVLRDSAAGSSGNQVARASGMTPRSAFRALTALETLGVVRRQRGGREHLFTLNRANHVVQHGLIPLLQLERELPEQVENEMRSLLSRHVVSAVLFGSTARGEEKPGSDMDLCCIVRGEPEKEKVRTALERSNTRLRDTFGIRISPIFFTVDEVRRKRASALVRQMVNDGRVMVGKTLREVLHG